MTTVRICVGSYFELVVPVKCQIHIYLRVSNEINLMGGKRDCLFFHKRKFMLLVPCLCYIYCILPIIK